MTDKRKIRIPGEDEEADILAAARSDPDNPPLTAPELANAAAIPAEKAAEMTRRFRGRQKSPTKIRTTIALDRDVVAHFKSAGRGWQTRINAALRRVAGLGEKAK